jgi:pre-mRNA-processing factor 39
VFEEGLSAIPLSVDLWLHFVNHVRATYEKEEGGEERVRSALERACTACGLEYR